MSCSGSYTTHKIVGNVRHKHSMNGNACRAGFKMILIDSVDGIERRGYHCTPCKVGVGESTSTMYLDLERSRRKAGKYKWPRRKAPRKVAAYQRGPVLGELS